MSGSSGLDGYAQRGGREIRPISAWAKVDQKIEACGLQRFVEESGSVAPVGDWRGSRAPACRLLAQAM